MMFLQINSYNLDVAKVFGVYTAVFLSCLDNEFEYQSRVHSISEDKSISLSRAEIYERTALDDEQQADVELSLSQSGVLIVKPLKNIPNKNYYSINFGDQLAMALSQKIKAQGTIMFVHCTSYSDDRQVMQYLGDKMQSLGYTSLYGAADHLKFVNKEAYSILDHHEGKIDCIFRFTPIEWLIDIKPKHWQGYFDTITPSCNHPIAIFAQTKRFPLVWEFLEKQGVNLSTWRELLPETLEVKEVKNRSGYIYKPACGRVGEKISIKEACKDDEYKKIIADVKKHPNKYIAQKRFNSKPIISEDGESFHVCLGSYSVNGKHGGYYARISKLPRIDSNAADIPVLIERGCK